MAPTELSLVAPLTGPVVPLEATPDLVFSRRLMGDGVAIEPLSSTLVAPCDGLVGVLHRSGHALTLTAAGGAEILLHVGIDTVALGGRGFSPHVAAGAHVRVGQPLISFDADAIARAAPCLQTIVLVANGERFAVAWRAVGPVSAGESPLMIVRPAIVGGALPEPEPEAAAGGPELSAEVRIGHAGGLHARPAALVREAARPFDAEASVHFADRRASTMSVVSLMALGAGQGDRVTASARGREAPQALAALVAALAAGGAVEPRAAPPSPSPIAARPPDGPGLTGVCAAPGLAIGRVVRLDAALPEVVERGEGLEAERGRLAGALAQVRAELAAAVRGATARGAAQERDIFAAHEALLEDPEIVAAAERAVGEGQSAGFALRRAVGRQCELLARVDSPLLVERIGDLRELERRVLRAMSGEGPPAPELFEQSVLVAEELGPAELTRLPRARLVGLATARGGATSHVAILARALGLPALVALGRGLGALAHGTEVLLDATAGRLHPEPTAGQLAAARAQVALASARRAEASAAARAPATTTDGHRIEVAANVACARDAEEAVEAGADGVGLLRTELLFLDRRDAPTEEEQRAAYQAVVDALGGRSAIIRTLDVGNDKELAYLPMAPEPNPALGLRGIRSALVRPDLLDTQLRALLGVRPLAACRIMLPMIADAGELARIRARLDALAREAGSVERPELGVMIEVPSAALLADQLAASADFFSIGTNDLTQYALAMDRLHPQLAPAVDGLHPAVLRLIAQTVEGAARHGRWVGLCGALASDLEAIPALVGLGVAELSVGVAAVAEVKARVRGLDREACRQEARRLLALTTAAQVRARVRERWPAQVGPTPATARGAP